MTTTNTPAGTTDELAALRAQPKLLPSEMRRIAELVEAVDGADAARPEWERAAAAGNTYAQAHLARIDAPATPEPEQHTAAPKPEPRPAAPKPEHHLEIVIIRDPDAPDTVKYFLNGRPVAPAELMISEYHVDPGASGADEEWQQSMEENAQGASPAVAAELRRQVKFYA
jgi:hypothetical protein